MGDLLKLELDPAKRAAQQIARRNVGQDIETMTIIIQNAYSKRTEEIKQEIANHCREVFELTFKKEDR